MKYVILLALILVFSICTLAQEEALEKAILIDPTNNNLDVYVPPDTLPAWDVPGHWVIIVIDSAKNVHRVDIQAITADAQRSMFTITPTAATAGHLTGAGKIIVTFGSKVIVVPASKPGSATATIAAAKDKQSSDIYLSGAYSPGLNGGDPQYSIDGSVAIMFDISRKHPEYGQLGFVGSVKTDKRKKVDPDSYRAFLAYQNVPMSKWWGPGDSIQGAQFTWLAVGTEFDRAGKNTNLISAPYFDFPIRLFPKQIRTATVPMAVLTPSVGFETGWNFHNALKPEKGGSIFRGFVGADLLYRFNPGLPGFKGVEFTTSWMLRVPAKKEIYTLTEKINGTDTDVPFLNRKPRHYVKSELTFKLNDYFGLTGKYEYGMLPPVFRRIDHKLSFGFSISAKQANHGVPSTIRNK